MEMNEGPIGIQQKALMPGYFEKVKKIERTGICQIIKKFKVNHRELAFVQG